MFIKTLFGEIRNHCRFIGENKDKGSIGSTGRTIANNLKERLVMEQAQSSTLLGQ